MSWSIPGAMYQRIAGDRFVRGLSGLRGRRLVKARSLLPRRFQPTVKVRRDELTIRISADPLDAEIVDSILNRHHDVYFPTSIGDPASVALVLEVGAHHGIYSVTAAHEYPNSTVIACEPSLEAARQVQAQVEENQLDGRVRVVPAALGSTPGLAVLSHETSGSWGATLFTPDTVTGTELVVTLTMAEVLAGQVPDIVKSNAEGAEFTLVDQIEMLADKPLFLVLAVHPEYGDVDALRGRLTGMGYAVVDAIAGHHPVWHCSIGTGPTDCASDRSG